MTYGKSLTAALALVLVAGCAGGASTTLVPAASQGPAAQPPAATARIPSGSSAARHILARVDTTRHALDRGEGGDDEDGGRGELELPPLQACGGGALATDCSAWHFVGAPGQRPPGRGVPLPTVVSTPDLNFCRDAALYPAADLGPAAVAPVAAAPVSFGLNYIGSQPGPIVSFATRWWAVDLSNAFADGTTASPAITVTPTLGDAAARGWLLFFTWSWPADILLVPFSVNELQVAAASSPLAIAAGGSSSLGAFDCLGRRIRAKTIGEDLAFDAAETKRSAQSASAELALPVYATAAGSGFVSLSDGHGARARVPVTVGSPAPLPTPSPLPTPTPLPTPSPLPTIPGGRG